MSSFASLIGSQDFSGAVRLLDGEIDELKPAFDATLQRLVQLYLNRGICNQRLQLNRKALKDFDAALALNPSSIKALLHKGQVLQALGKASDACVTWQQASALADPTSDLDFLLQINEALAGIGASPSTAAAAAPPPPPPPAPLAAAAPAAAAPAPEAAVPAQATPHLTEVPHETLADSAAGTAAPQPQLSLEAGIAAPHANGVIAAGQTSLSSDAKQLTATPAAAAGATAAAAAGGKSEGAKPAPKAFKGFLGKSAAGSNKAAGSAASTAKASVPAAAAASSGSSAATAASSNDTVEIDCAQQQKQQKQQKQQQAAPISFGEQVAQQQQHSVMLTLAINQINNGHVEAAEEILNKLLENNPAELSALVARGTARALRRDLQGAEADFTKAIEIEPRYADTYKRRGQARSAMNNLKGALDDLEKATQLLEASERDGTAAFLRQQGGDDGRGTAAECYSERGMLLQKLKDYRKAHKMLMRAAKADPKNPQVWNWLGLARVSMGDIRDGVEAYKKALELVPDMQEAWLNMGQACKEEARVDEADRALTKALKNSDGTPCLPAYRLLATMRQGAGRQADAIKLIDKALSFKKESIELLYLRAICWHALGYIRKAVADYEACMHLLPRPKEEGPLAEEAKMFQYLCYYQRELALWMWHNLDTRAADICLDTELAPAFKEGWCKKCYPEPRTLQTHRPQPPLPPDNAGGGGSGGSKRGSSASNSPRGSTSGPSSSTSPSTPGTSSRISNSADEPSALLEPALPTATPEQVAALTDAADKIGNLLQNHHQGFLPNVRQQRAAGYAALELAQTVRALLAERAAGRDGLWVNSEGSSGQGGCSGRHLFGWRDAMDIVVKWRQLSEPADQVVWVDLLTKEEFENGFGSHTPMYSGQTKCVRYYMNFERALGLAKECLQELGHAYDATNHEVPLGGQDKQDAVKAAKTALELYKVIGQDSWVVVPLYSIHKHLQTQTAAANGTSTSSTANGNTKGSSSSKASSKASSGKSSSSNSGRGGRGRGVLPVVVPGGCVEGTRLTLVNVPNQPDAVEFSIRTPVTPPRWKEFDAELEAAWERIVAAMLSGDKRSIATAVMCYAYYWYNFMPLARGTAAVGYTTMLGLFWAAGMPITTPIPKDYQVDWEAILAKHPQQFIDRLSEWFVPQVALPCAPIPGSSVAGAPASAAAGGSNGSSGTVVLPEVESMPEVNEVLGTFRQRLNALNGPQATPV